MFNGKTHYKWPFSIAMLVYQRVPQIYWPHPHLSSSFHPKKKRFWVIDPHFWPSLDKPPILGAMFFHTWIPRQTGLSGNSHSVMPPGSSREEGEEVRLKRPAATDGLLGMSSTKGHQMCLFISPYDSPKFGEYCEVNSHRKWPPSYAAIFASFWPQLRNVHHKS